MWKKYSLGGAVVVLLIVLTWLLVEERHTKNRNAVSSSHAPTEWTTETDGMGEPVADETSVHTTVHVVTPDMVWQNPPECITLAEAEESPDGSRVAFIGFIDDGRLASQQLLIQDTNSGEWTALPTAFENGETRYMPSIKDLSWTYDGRLLLLDTYHEQGPFDPQGESRVYSLRVMDPTGVNSIELAKFDPGWYAFSSNAAGTVTLVTRQDEESITVLKLSLGGQELSRKMIPFSEHIQELTLNQEGSELWFTMYKRHDDVLKTSINYLDLDTQEVYPVLDDAVLYDIAPDGNTVLFGEFNVTEPAKNNFGYYSLDTNAATWLGKFDSFPLPLRFAGNRRAIYLKGFRDGIHVENDPAPCDETEGLFRLALDTEAR